MATGLEPRPSGGSEGGNEVARQAVRIGDPERAHDLLTRTYARHRPRISGDSGRFRFSLSTADAGSICADTLRHSMNVRAEVEPLYHLTAGSVTAGTVTVRTGGQEERFGPGDVVLYPYGVGYEVQWDRFYPATAASAVRGGGGAGRTDIASNVRVGPRALQRAFARHRDSTPMGYLRRVRLHNAHRDLQRADPDSDSVTRIARRWGFGTPARFAAHYQRVYGVHPHETLRAASAPRRGLL